MMKRRNSILLSSKNTSLAKLDDSHVMIKDMIRGGGHALRMIQTMEFPLALMLLG
jgi:hypothetical protein